MNQVESFKLDHDQVAAPYIRKAKVVEIDPRFPECLISKFDIRFAQPNEETIPSDALHTLEHLFATFCREYTDALIDISPMGCRTGFYFIFSGNQEASWVAELVRKALQETVKFEEAIPGATQKECGNYREHDLVAARNWAKRFLSVSAEQLTDVFRSRS